MAAAGPAPAEIAARVAAALDAPAGGPLAAAIPAAAATVIIVDAVDARARAAIAPVLDALVRSGHPRGRLLVLGAVHPERVEAGAAARAALRDAAGAVPAVLHDPDRSPSFRAGATRGGIEVALDDELREAEAIVAVGAWRDGGWADAGIAERLLVPGLASRATWERLSARRAIAAGSRAAEAEAELVEAARLVPVDFEVGWIAAGAWPVRAGVPPFAREALARAARES